MSVRDGDGLAHAIAHAVESLPEGRAAFLFGWHALVNACADSDIDVAVLLEPWGFLISDRVALDPCVSKD